MYKSENIVYIAVFSAAICVYNVDGKLIENLTSSNTQFDSVGTDFSMLKISTDNNERYFLPNIYFDKDSSTISRGLGITVAGMGIKQAYGRSEVDTIVKLATEHYNQGATVELPQQINVVDYRALAAKSSKKLLIIASVIGVIGLALLLIPGGLLVSLVSLIVALGFFIGYYTSK